MKPRLNLYLDYQLLKQVEAVSNRTGASKSNVIEVAVASYVSPAAYPTTQRSSCPWKSNYVSHGTTSSSPSTAIEPAAPGILRARTAARCKELDIVESFIHFRQP